MINKICLLMVFVVLISLTFVSAETFIQEGVIDFKKTCTNTTGSTCSSSALCNISIKLPINNTYIVESGVMSNNNEGIFNYTLPSASTSILGNYNWDMFCCDGTDCGEAHGSFDVTKTGVELSQEKAIIYLGLLIVLGFFFIVDIAGISLLPSRNNVAEDGLLLSINHLKYLRVVLFAVAWGILLAILFTSSNIAFLYLETTMMGSLLFAFYTAMMWLTIPMVFVWFIWIIVSIFNDKEMKTMLERGVQVQTTP